MPRERGLWDSQVDNKMEEDIFEERSSTRQPAGLGKPRTATRASVSGSHAGQKWRQTPRRDLDAGMRAEKEDPCEYELWCCAGMSCRPQPCSALQCRAHPPLPDCLLQLVHLCCKARLICHQAVTSPNASTWADEAERHGR